MLGGRKVRFDSNPSPPSTNTPQKLRCLRNSQAPRYPVSQEAVTSPKEKGTWSMLMLPTSAASAHRESRSQSSATPASCSPSKL